MPLVGGIMASLIVAGSAIQPLFRSATPYAGSSSSMHSPCSDEAHRPSAKRGVSNRCAPVVTFQGIGSGEGGISARRSSHATRLGRVTPPRRSSRAGGAAFRTSVPRALCRLPSHLRECAFADTLAGHPVVERAIADAVDRGAKARSEVGFWIFPDSAARFRISVPMYGGEGRLFGCRESESCMPQLKSKPRRATVTGDTIVEPVVASVHTHPNTPMPSLDDYWHARSQEIYAFVATRDRLTAIGPDGFRLWERAR